MNAKRLLIGALVVGVLAALFVFTSPDEEERQTIIISDTQFETLWINNALAAFIIENGYDYPVDMVEMSTAVMQQSLANGDVHLHTELWRFNIIDWYNEATEAGDVIDLGPTYERATQGWYVPRYVIEGDPERNIEAVAPDLRSVFDLPDYVHLFPDPENPDKGVMVNCIIGWQCQEINRIKLHAYGLADTYNMIEVGSSAAMDSVIVSAYQRGEPILTYYWEPTSIIGAYDLVQLEEPEYTEEGNAEIQRALAGEIPYEEVSERAGIAYEEHSVNKGIHSSLQDFAPEVVDFLRNMNVGTDPLNQALAFMMKEDVEADEAAIWYLENFQDRWRGWVPADVERKVEDALREAGANV